MRVWLAIGTCLLAAACGDSDTGGTPPPNTPNAPPSFTSAATANVVENVSAAYQAVATDPQGTAITYSISGGADAARFAITPAGALTFVATPNFEAPADADANNVYLVQLNASDGSLTSTLELAVTVTNSREGIAVRRVATTFDQPLAIAPVPGDDTRVFVATKTGRVWRLRPENGEMIFGFDVENISTDGERGLLGVAGAPDYGTTGEVLVYVTNRDGSNSIRRCFTSDLPAQRGCRETILTIPNLGLTIHNGGWLAFGPDGYLYASTGDGGPDGDTAQDVNSRLGKILRLARNPDPFAGASPQYYIPAPGNPFAAGGGDPYVFALGLRNPFRNSFAPDGRLVIGDVGENRVEEVNVLRTDQPGVNFGWPYFEGSLPYRGTAPAGLTPPVTEYVHGTGPKEGNSVIGGYVYRGPVTSLRGLYVFADFVSGNIWTLPYSALAPGTSFAAAGYERRNLDFTPDINTFENISALGEDNLGNLYIADFNGSIYMVTPG